MPSHALSRDLWGHIWDHVDDLAAARRVSRAWARGLRLRAIRCVDAGAVTVSPGPPGCAHHLVRCVCPGPDWAAAFGAGLVDAAPALAHLTLDGWAYGRGSPEGQDGLRPRPLRLPRRLEALVARHWWHGLAGVAAALAAASPDTPPATWRRLEVRGALGPRPPRPLYAGADWLRGLAHAELRGRRDCRLVAAGPHRLWHALRAWDGAGLEEPVVSRRVVGEGLRGLALHRADLQPVCAREIFVRVGYRLDPPSEDEGDDAPTMGAVEPSPVEDVATVALVRRLRAALDPDAPRHVLSVTSAPADPPSGRAATGLWAACLGRDPAHPWRAGCLALDAAPSDPDEAAIWRPYQHPGAPGVLLAGPVDPDMPWEGLDTTAVRAMHLRLAPDPDDDGGGGRGLRCLQPHGWAAGRLRSLLLDLGSPGQLAVALAWIGSPTAAACLVHCRLRPDPGRRRPGPPVPGPVDLVLPDLGHAAALESLELEAWPDVASPRHALAHAARAPQLRRLILGGPLGADDRPAQPFPCLEVLGLTNPHVLPRTGHRPWLRPRSLRGLRLVGELRPEGGAGLAAAVAALVDRPDTVVLDTHPPPGVDDHRRLGRTHRRAVARRLAALRVARGGACGPVCVRAAGIAPSDARVWSRALGQALAAGLAEGVVPATAVLDCVGDDLAPLAAALRGTGGDGPPLALTLTLHVTSPPGGASGWLRRAVVLLGRLRRLVPDHRVCLHVGLHDTWSPSDLRLLHTAVPGEDALDRVSNWRLHLSTSPR